MAKKPLITRKAYREYMADKQQGEAGRPRKTTSKKQNAPRFKRTKDQDQRRFHWRQDDRFNESNTVAPEVQARPNDQFDRRDDQADNRPFWQSPAKQNKFLNYGIGLTVFGIIILTLITFFV
ncbi:hypothetical protein AWM75_06625 [Aerococcus urinaehominis]|uniref:Uncharacterized protein n=1 Tax=Aerococcus urinaehominis TaxID=128944 RepID=A0A0X8FLU5_9LACT|nr:hypothetical protein [Aerococcus urinaehominis]AMB99675.1 hypothetical protein AWM75_06625 [Aerococcus urinaehominis]SDL89939.1 hypothetical protein SAMN04487985_102123 [Aerococcus urinaehominis]